MKLKVIDLFSGAGLFSAGFQTAGHEIVLGVDDNPVCLKSFQANFPDSMVWEVDILELESLPRADIIIGGPPCQPFSLANRNRDPTEGMDLVLKFIELCTESKPKYWIMENVPPVKKELKDTLSDEWIKSMIPRMEVWESSKFGSKNLRPRFFCGNFPDPYQHKNPYLEPASTIKASDNESIQVFKELQGVPGWMQFFGTETEIKSQIGNGVSFDVGLALGLGIMYHEQGKTVLGHQDWHTLGSTYHRSREGIRPYLPINTQKWCEECQDTIRD